MSSIAISPDPLPAAVPLQPSLTASWSKPDDQTINPARTKDPPTPVKIEIIPCRPTDRQQVHAVHNQANRTVEALEGSDGI